MDNTQKSSDFGESIEKSTAINEEERKQKEQRARKLQALLENAEKAVEGYQQLLAKRRREMGNRKYDKDTWTFGLIDRKKKLEGFKAATPSAKHDSSVIETNPESRENLEHPQLEEETRRENDAFSSSSQDDLDHAKARPHSE